MRLFRLAPPSGGAPVPSALRGTWYYEVFGNQLMLTSEQGTQLGPFPRQPGGSGS